MAYNNFFNFNNNPYYTPTSFSDITNPAYHNFNQPSVPDWSYPNQYNPYPHLITIISRIISTLHRVSGDSPPPSLIFNQLVLLLHLVHNIFKIHTQFHQSKIGKHQFWKWVCVSPNKNHKIWWTHNFTTNSKTTLHLFIKIMNLSTMKDAWSHDSGSKWS